MDLWIGSVFSDTSIFSLNASKSLRVEGGTRIESAGRLAETVFDDSKRCSIIIYTGIEFL